jgi:IclR family acetate operon transcriptional repressor
MTVTTRQSHLERGLRVLELLAAGQCTAAEIARGLAVNRSTALRLLNELAKAGYVRRDETTKLYRTVSERLYALAVSERSPHDWTELIDPLLARLRDEFGESTILGVPANGSVVYLAFFPTDHPVGVREHIGSVRPMHASALGKAYLAALDERSLAIELQRVPFQGGTARAARDAAELGARLEDVRATGFAVDREETFDGVRCVAVAASVRGAIVGAVGVSGPAQRFPDAHLAAIGGRLVAELASVEARV